MHSLSSMHHQCMHQSIINASSMHSLTSMHHHVPVNASSRHGQCTIRASSMHLMINAWSLHAHLGIHSIIHSAPPCAGAFTEIDRLAPPAATHSRNALAVIPATAHPASLPTDPAAPHCLPRFQRHTNHDASCHQCHTRQP